MQENDFPLLAVIDAYKWWISTDYGLLRMTGALDAFGTASGLGVSQVDVRSLRNIAKAYSVSRNIPSDATESNAQRIVDLFASTSPIAIRSEDLLVRAETLAAMSRNTPMYVRKSDGSTSPRQLASALSKISWFVHPYGWTIFDKYVGVAVIGEDGSGLEQMLAFYKKLAPSWSAISVDVCSAVNEAGFHPLLGYRIIDKFMFCHGLSMYRDLGQSGKAAKLDTSATLEERLSRRTVQDYRQSLMWSLEALGNPLARSLSQLSDRLSESLAKLPIYQGARRS